MLYSGDDFYGDEITSGPNVINPFSLTDERPMTEQDRAFKKWLQRLDAIVWNRVGCSLDDLEDFDTFSGFEDGLTAAQFYREYIAPEIGEE